MEPVSSADDLQDELILYDVMSPGSEVMAMSEEEATAILTGR